MVAISGMAGARRPVAIERALILPGGPDDARQLVGEGDSRLVVTATALGMDCPAAQAIRISSAPCGAERGVEHGPGAVDQQCAQVDVAALADAPEPAALAGGVLPRGPLNADVRR